MMRVDLPDVVDAEWTDEHIREVYGDDSVQILAFRRFLALPRNDEGRVVCPQHWYDWGMGRISAADVLLLDAADRECAESTKKETT